MIALKIIGAIIGGAAGGWEGVGAVLLGQLGMVLSCLNVR